MDSCEAMIDLYDFSEMGDGASEGAVAEDVPKIEPSLPVEGEKVLAAGGLARQRRQDEVRGEAVDHPPELGRFPPLPSQATEELLDRRPRPPSLPVWS